MLYYKRGSKAVSANNYINCSTFLTGMSIALSGCNLSTIVRPQASPSSSRESTLSCPGVVHPDYLRTSCFLHKLDNPASLLVRHDGFWSDARVTNVADRIGWMLQRSFRSPPLLLWYHNHTENLSSGGVTYSHTLGPTEQRTECNRSKECAPASRSLGKN